MIGRIVALGALGAFLLAGAGAWASQDRAAAVGLTQIGRFNSPTHVAFAPGEPGRVYVVEKTGRIVVVEKGRVRTFLDLRSQVSREFEQGLLSIAFDPAYPKNHFFYVDYTDRKGDTRVMRFQSRAGRALPASGRELLFVDQPDPIHNGGQLQFGSDGLLYVGLGDGGPGQDPEGRGQKLDGPFAKILRTNPHRLPARWSTVAYGLRNPWRFSFDRKTGDLLIGDVGQGRWEEVDYLARREIGGTPENFGWSVYEAHRKFSEGEPSGPGRLVFPIAEYPHDKEAERGKGDCSVTGGYVYRGSAVPAIVGRYLYGDFCTGTIRSFRIVKGKAVDPRVERIRVLQISSFGQDARGELYAASLNGPVYRIHG